MVNLIMGDQTRPKHLHTDPKGEFDFESDIGSKSGCPVANLTDISNSPSGSYTYEEKIPVENGQRFHSQDGKDSIIVQGLKGGNLSRESGCPVTEASLLRSLPVLEPNKSGFLIGSSDSVFDLHIQKVLDVKFFIGTNMIEMVKFEENINNNPGCPVVTKSPDLILQSFVSLGIPITSLSNIETVTMLLSPLENNNPIPENISQYGLIDLMCLNELTCQEDVSSKPGCPVAHPPLHLNQQVCKRSKPSSSGVVEFHRLRFTTESFHEYKKILKVAFHPDTQLIQPYQGARTETEAGWVQEKLCRKHNYCRKQPDGTYLAHSCNYNPYFTRQKYTSRIQSKQDQYSYKSQDISPASCNYIDPACFESLKYTSA